MPKEMSRTTSFMMLSIFGATSSAFASERMARLPHAMSNPTPEMEILSL